MQIADVVPATMGLPCPPQMNESGSRPETLPAWL